jgi:REP element-mobilizing transposase RayT/transposase-like protein
MPRQARLDAPGTLHHVMIRGIERSPIFKDDQDRQDFVSRTGILAQETGTKILAWVLMRNHVHLLFFSGPTGISKFMRRLLTGYALRYNRRHRRNGHLFQNRYKSIICEEGSYLLELVRYIHLNPLRAAVVKSMGELDHYRWSGHMFLVGKGKNDWQERKHVLGQFHEKEGKAIRAYRRFMEEGKNQGRRPELVGGGLIRSLGGWSQVLPLGGARKMIEHDCRILGSGDFVTEIIREAEKKVRRYIRVSEMKTSIDNAIKEICRKEGVAEQALRMGVRTRKYSRVRAKISYYLSHEFGVSRAEIARQLGVCTSAIAKAIQNMEGTE